MLDGMNVGEVDWFDGVYQRAEGNSRLVPWSRGAADPGLRDWLRRNKPSPGDRAVVVGCGLGDDAEAMADGGWQVTAFDVSETAIAWCRQRFPASLVHYQWADLFELPAPWFGVFQVVVEFRTIQSLSLEMRDAAIAAVSGLVAPGGRLLAAGLYRAIHDSVPPGPPWAVSQEELRGFEHHELRRTRWHAAGPRFEVEYERAGS